MGFLGDKKANDMAKDAAEAHARGDEVFVALLSTLKVATQGGPLGGWAQQVQAVEAVGWKLEQWSVTSVAAGISGGMSLQAAPVFRRR